MIRQILLCALTVASVSAQNDLSCSSKMDLAFLVDSSSSVGAENFDLIRNFIINIIQQFDIKPERTQVSLARYNSWTEPIFHFNTYDTKSEVIDAVGQVPYYGRGTRTAEGLRVVASQLLNTHKGWRENDVPTVVIVITDGQANDAEQIPTMARRLRRKSTRVISVGIGNIDENELRLIASRPVDDNVIAVTDFTDLVNLVIQLAEMTCEVDGDINECKTENGGCDINCVNMIGSFYCECPIGYNLVEDTQCQDINECLVDNGGCSDQCDNKPGSFGCSCSVGNVVGPDQKTCVVDSCYDSNLCSQNCVNVFGGDVDYRCTCNAGYKLAEDGYICNDVDECETNNGGCEYSCNNTVGSYVCGCPEGLGLRDDGRTCGIICYTCDRAFSNEECRNETVCPINENSCQTHLRSEEGIVYISKMCKQTEACVNNYLQNPTDAWSPTQCNESPSGTVSVCRCCCHESYCNAPGDCSLASKIDIECPDPTFIDVPEGMNISCSGNTIGDVCDLVCPVGFAPENDVEQIVCTHRPRTLEGDWLGEVSDCVDIDECQEGLCSHFCENAIGSFACSCPADNTCEKEKKDVLFILDSSSSVGNANFELMKTFVKYVGSELDIGQDSVRVAALRYNRVQEESIAFKDCENNLDFVEKVDNITYDGQGTRTAAAIKAAVEKSLTQEAGRRAYVPLVVIIITDGRSQDNYDLPDALSRIYAQTENIYAIGISNKVNERELLQIANNRLKNYKLVANFAALNEELATTFVAPNLCVDAEGEHILQADGLNCDINECLRDNGRCSDSCNNTIGSYYCSCPEGFILIEDGLTCAYDMCLIDNGGCEFDCITLSTGVRCLCPDNKAWDGEQCVGYDECSDENAGCSHSCVDTEDGYICECPLGMIVGNDKHTCEIDSCYEQEYPSICDHTCENIGGGSYVCKCDDGYIMEQDGHNCTEINECDIANGGCEYTCVNTEGSFRCECPSGLQLRDDKRTCGITCYSCERALVPEEECTVPVICGISEDACYTTHRTRDNVTTTWKGCRQTESCINQMMQNPALQGEGPTQCNTQGQNSKCECCCLESLCNEGDCPYNFTLPGCPSFDWPNVVFTGVQQDGTIFPGGTARVTCDPGYEYSLRGAGFVQINCIYNFANETSEWDGDFNLFDSCSDINECEQWYGDQCVAPAMCVNTPGSYECQCPEEPSDYVLIDGVMCERDECADEDQGGCSHNCTNTIGGYFCSCEPGFSVVEDGLTCDLDECQYENGGCKHLCVNILGGHDCRCHSEGYRLDEDGETCIDVDECLVDNGGCSEMCTNEEGGYTCSCPEDMILANDGFSCKPNPCFPNNGNCSHICRVVGDDNFICECPQGFESLDDGTCADINECDLHISNCEYNCTNFDGGYSCECPPGKALRSDGRTCGVACYVCNGAASNEECNTNLEVCPADADACENEVREHGGQKLIFKRCKQAHACNNNHIQNLRQAWAPTQCNGDAVNDVCRCCCSGHLCNFNEKPCQSSFKCNIKQADVVLVVDSSSSVKHRNFAIIKNFLYEFINTLSIGPDKTRVSLVRYNADVDTRFQLNELTTKDDVLDAVDSMPYNGKGTLTGQALQHVIDNEITEEAGAREGVDKIVITLTDGKAGDNVAPPSEELRSIGVKTYAIGVGPNLDESELNMIAGDESRLFIGSSFEDLSSVIIAQVQESVCADTDECALNNGGCSDICVNTDGSYYCECPVGMVLEENMQNCVESTNATFGFTPVDECAIENGGCQMGCVDTYIGYNCTCEDGFGLREDLHSCAEIDECAQNVTNLCSDGCVNTLGSFFCDCPSDHYMAEDRLNCIPREGDADCPFGFTSIGTDCVQVLEDVATFSDAEIACSNIGARLWTIRNPGAVRIMYRLFPNEIGYWTAYDDQDEDGVFTNDEEIPLEFDNLWGQEQPKSGLCAIINPANRNMLESRDCLESFVPVCQIPRESGFVVFTNTWQNGAQGKIFFPVGYGTYKIVFPLPVKSFTGWFGSVVDQLNDKTFVVTQTEHEVSSSNGEMQFVVDFKRHPFASYDIEVTIFETDEI